MVLGLTTGMGKVGIRACLIVPSPNPDVTIRTIAPWLTTIGEGYKNSKSSFFLLFLAWVNPFRLLNVKIRLWIYTFTKKGQFGPKFGPKLAKMDKSYDFRDSDLIFTQNECFWISLIKQILYNTEFDVYDTFWSNIWPNLAQIGPIFWFDRYGLQIDTNQEFLQTINKF